MFSDHVWFFRLFIIMGIVLIYRVLLQYVLSSNHCPNPFCTKCLGIGTIRDRALKRLQNSLDSEDNSLNSIVHTNLFEHDRLRGRNIEKPTVYFHRGLSSGDVNLPKTYTDEQILIDQFDDIRQDIIKFLQKQDENLDWTNFYLFKNGEEII